MEAAEYPSSFLLPFTDTVVLILAIIDILVDALIPLAITDPLMAAAAPLNTITLDADFPCHPDQLIGLSVISEMSENAHHLHLLVRKPHRISLTGNAAIKLLRPGITSTADTKEDSIKMISWIDLIIMSLEKLMLSIVAIYPKITIVSMNERKRSVVRIVIRGRSIRELRGRWESNSVMGIRAIGIVQAGAVIAPGPQGGARALDAIEVEVVDSLCV